MSPISRQDLLDLMKHARSHDRADLLQDGAGGIVGFLDCPYCGGERSIQVGEHECFCPLCLRKDRLHNPRKTLIALGIGLPKPKCDVQVPTSAGKPRSDHDLRGPFVGNRPKSTLFG